ncbi:MAG: hypothetical protein VX527_02640 [Planctomycetota bacterium]|nr:hypothetical protein [Planctomycetota bacterium]
MTSKMKKFAIVVPACAALLLATACQSGYRNHAKTVNNAYKAGDYHQAAAVAKTGASSRASDETERVIYHLEAARTAQVAGDYEVSTTHYEAAYEDVRPFLDTEAEDTVSEAIVTTGVNQAMRTYKSTPGERIMMNSMNSLNYLAVGDRESARLELNRAADWQQDAVLRNEKRILAEQRAIESDAKKNNVAGAAKSDMPDNMKSYYSNLDNMSGYADYENPFTSHLRGIYLMTNGTDDGDRSNARLDLRKAVQANPNCEPALREDLLVLENSQRYGIPATTWVYFMTGRAPYYEELEIVVPIPVSEVPSVKAAFPVLKTNEDHVRYMEVSTDETGTVRSVELADIDGVVASDFQNRLPVIVAQELASAAGKAAATYGMSEGLGGWGTAMGTLYQHATAEADLRAWQTMPKEIQVCRVPTPANGTLRLMGAGGRSFGTIRVVPNESNIVVVTMPSAMAMSPAIMTVPLTGTVMIGEVDIQSSQNGM